MSEKKKPGGANYNEYYFLKSRPYLSRRIIRTKIKGTMYRPAVNYEADPKLYSIPKCAATDALIGLNISWLSLPRDIHQVLACDGASLLISSSYETLPILRHLL